MTKKQEYRILKILGLSILIMGVLIWLNLPGGLGPFIGGLSIGLIVNKIK